MALTLGRSRGVALIGRTLEVAIPVTLDNAGQAADLCAEADVFHGDSRVDGAQVSVRVEPAAGLNAVVRVRSSLPVDEPVVTVYLRLGCTQKITRRYVMLSEEPGEFVQPAAAVLPTAAAAIASPEAPQPGSSALTTASRNTAAGKSERTLARAQPRVGLQARAASPTGRSRLTVDMLDLTPERAPQLRASQGLAGLPSSSDQVRAQAAALWRAINAQPEDVMRDMQRVQALEADLKGLKALVVSNDRALLELREQLTQARQERSLTLAAIALLTLLLAALVVTWWLRRADSAGSRDWRRRDAAAGLAQTGDAPRGPNAPTLPPVREAQMDLRVDESMFESLKAPPRGQQLPVASAPATAPVHVAGDVVSDAAPASAQPTGLDPSQVASMRLVRAEELVDIQQQADFFMSLGQTEQAIEVLESHIRDNAETSVLVWLDLLAIYRALKRRADYESLRGDFQRVFNADVPRYDSTPTSSGGLEDYPRALSRIAALWPSPQVMDVIEESIFRRPGASEGEPFDLEAYRELVMLYNLGREVVHADLQPAGEWTRTETPSSEVIDASMQPLSESLNSPCRVDDDGDDVDPESDARQHRDLRRIVVDSMLDDGETPETTVDELHDPQIPRPSPRLGLDIDLSAWGETDRPPASHRTSDVDFEPSAPGDGGLAR